MVEILQVGVQASKEPGVSAGDQDKIKPILFLYFVDIIYIETLSFMGNHC